MRRVVYSGSAGRGFDWFPQATRSCRSDATVVNTLLRLEGRGGRYNVRSRDPGAKGGGSSRAANRAERHEASRARPAGSRGLRERVHVELRGVSAGRNGILLRELSLLPASQVNPELSRRPL